MYVAVVGSRGFKDRALFNAVLDEELNEEDVIVTGYNRKTDKPDGPDRWAFLYSLTHEVEEPMLFPAEWDKYGRSAGYQRNTDIVELAERVIAFWDLESNGTRDSINKAIKAKKPVLIIAPKGDRIVPTAVLSKYKKIEVIQETLL